MTYKQVGNTPGPCPASCRSTLSLEQKTTSMFSSNFSSKLRLDQTKMGRYALDGSNSETCGKAIKKRSREAQDYKPKITNSSEPEVALDRIWCPISGCENFGGRGYKRSYIVKHLNSHNDVLMASEEKKTKLAKVLGEFNGPVKIVVGL